MHFIGRLALEALQLRNIQCRILRSYQLVGAYLDAVQRSRCLLKIVAAIKHLSQHDLGVGVILLQGYGLFQPFLRIVKLVGKQRNAAQLEGSRIVPGILGGYSRVQFASFGKLPNLEEPIGSIDF